MNKPYEFALSQFGIKEIYGKQDNPEVLKYFDEIGFDGSKLKDETSWCSAFVNWCCMKAGFQITGKLNARSWLDIGVKTEEPNIGDIAIFWRESPESWKGHVAFFVAKRNGYIWVLGGNQNDQVKISAYHESRLLGYRIPLKNA